jgi:hypothetical protein
MIYCLRLLFLFCSSAHRIFTINSYLGDEPYTWKVDGTSGASGKPAQVGKRHTVHLVLLPLGFVI